MTFGTRFAVAKCHTALSMRILVAARLPIAHIRRRALTGGGNRRDLNHDVVAGYQLKALKTRGWRVGYTSKP